MSPIRRTLLLLPPVLLAALLWPAAAHAQDGDGGGGEPPPQWAVEPGGPDGPGDRPNFAYNLQPGRTLQDVVSISNISNEIIEFAIYPKDAYNTPRDAAFALLADEETAVGVGSWITLGRPEGHPESPDGILRYTLGPRTRVDVPFALTVPEDAEPGDHAGGIIAANTAPVSSFDDEGLSIAVRHRIAARVYVRVDGPVVPALQVEAIGIDHSMPIVPWVTGRGDASITYEVRNVGNVRLDPFAEVKVTGLFGRTIKTFPARELPELLPGSSVVVTQQWSGLPPIEPLNASVRVEAGDGSATAARSKGFFVWSWAAVVIGTVLAAWLAYRIWRRYRPRSADAGPRHRKDDPGDELAPPSGLDHDGPAPVDDSSATEDDPIEEPIPEPSKEADAPPAAPVPVGSADDRDAAP